MTMGVKARIETIIEIDTIQTVAEVYENTYGNICARVFFGSLSFFDIYVEPNGLHDEMIVNIAPKLFVKLETGVKHKEILLSSDTPWHIAVNSITAFCNEAVKGYI